MSATQGWAAPDPDRRPPPPVAPPTAPSPEPSPSGPGGQPPGDDGWQAAPGWGGPPPPRDQGWQPPPGWGGAPWPAREETKPGIVPLRPLGLGELLDGAVTLLRRYPRPTLGLAAGIAVITTLLDLPLLIAAANNPLFDGTVFDESGATAIDVDGALGGLFAGLGATSLITFLADVVLAGIITAVVGQGVLGRSTSLRESWAAVRPQLGRLLGLAVLVLLIVYGGLVLAVVVGTGVILLAGPVGAVVGIPLVIGGVVFAVYAYVRLALAPSALVLERVGVRESLRRSSVLVKGDWWRVFGILLLSLVITTFVASVLQAPFQARSFLTGFSGEGGLSAFDIVLQSIGATIALSLVAPFDAGVRALLYVDRRIRAEALDVQLTAALQR